MSKFLDQSGLEYFWGKIKSYISSAVKVTGVKGNNETTYRTGDVNLTPANIGASSDSHTHGNITNAGDITTSATIASGDRLVINDESTSKITNSSITFGNSTTKYLSNAGTWVDTPTYAAGTGLSLSGTTFNHSNSITAQTTQSVYPIKIDAQGHISEYGSAITIPTKTSELTNDSGFITNAGVTGVKGNSESSYRTGQVNLTAANVGAVDKSGDTMTGKLTLKANQTTDAYNSGALDLKNSNIDGVNSIYTADLSDNSQEGIHFYRDSTHVDSLYARSGLLYFTPNRQLGTTGIPQEVYSIPQYQRGTTDISIRPLISRARANRLAFLPANQIIIEKTTDGGNTWVDGGYTDAQKIGLFATSGSINIPLLNGAKSELCGVRITITGMRYDVPSGTSEVNKYSYWNSEYILSQERYFNVREWWFWLSSNNDTIQCEIQAATGANSTTWKNMFNTEFHMTGWSGSDWIRAGNGATFGGGSTQTGNYWNWRLIFWSRKADNKDTFQSTTAQSINIIQCYGDSVWGSPNSLMSNDHLYSYDNSQNVTFPAKVTASGGFSGNLTGNVTGNVSGSAGSVAWSGVSSKPTTISGYGITDAKISNGVITLGGNTITPLTSYTETDPIFSASAAAGITSSDITNWNSKTSNTGTVTSVRVQATSPVQSSTNTAQTSTLNTTISLADGYGDTKNPYASKTKNYVLAAPSTANGVPSFRALVAADIPTLTVSKISDFPTIPSKTSELTNDSGFITSYTDTKLQVSDITSGTTYYPIVGTGTTASTRQYDTSGFSYIGTNGNLSVTGTAKLVLGNNIASGTINNKQGQIVLYGSSSYATTITSGGPTAARTITLPNASGTVALTSNIPTVPTNISAFNNDVGYITSYVDTKNTAGSTDTSSKIFLIGATTQSANPQTYSHDTAYVGTNGHLYSASKEVLVGGSNSSSNVTITPSTTSVYSMSSTGSVTTGTAAKFTRGTFNGGALNMSMDTTDTKKLNISFTAATHANDTFIANTATRVTLPGRTQVIGIWNGYTSAVADAQTFTGATS